ncbi:MAG: hypothetical protein KGZ82_10640 [Bacteroidales bacterium]|nr:hypothetical protein [Bacteroidales bacterium]
MAEKIRFPFDDAQTIALTATGAQALTIVDTVTIIDGVTVPATGNRTLNLTIDSEVPVGARMFVKSKTDGTETTAFGPGMTGATITGVAGKTKTKSFTYDGSKFVAEGEQID